MQLSYESIDFSGTAIRQRMGDLVEVWKADGTQRGQSNKEIFIRRHVDLQVALMAQERVRTLSQRLSRLTTEGPFNLRQASTRFRAVDSQLQQAIDLLAAPVTAASLESAKFVLDRIYRHQVEGRPGAVADVGNAPLSAWIVNLQKELEFFQRRETWTDLLSVSDEDRVAAREKMRISLEKNLEELEASDAFLAVLYVAGAVAVVTKPKSLYDDENDRNVEFGRFVVSFGFANASADTSPTLINVYALEPNDHAGYVHPHVTNYGDVCLGDNTQWCRTQAADGDIVEAALAVDSILSNYGDNPYVPLDQWGSDDEEHDEDSEHCEGCGEYYTEGEMYDVDDESRRRCYSCSRECHICSDRVSLPRTARCGSRYSTGGARRSISCENRICSTCIDHRVADPRASLDEMVLPQFCASCGCHRCSECVGIVCDTCGKHVCAHCRSVRPSEGARFFQNLTELAPATTRGICTECAAQASSGESPTSTTLATSAPSTADVDLGFLPASSVATDVIADAFSAAAAAGREAGVAEAPSIVEVSETPPSLLFLQPDDEDDSETVTEVAPPNRRRNRSRRSQNGANQEFLIPNQFGAPGPVSTDSEE